MRTITLDEFLNEILHLPTDWIKQNKSQISCIVDTKPFLDKVSTYCQPVGCETHHYPPFIILTNYVIDQLVHHSESNLSFCCNDPIYVKGSSGQQKPDVVGDCWRSLQIAERSSVDNLMKEGPNEQPFWWTELLSFLELKLDHHDRSELVGCDVWTRDRSLSKFYHCSNPSVIPTLSQWWSHRLLNLRQKPHLLNLNHANGLPHVGIPHLAP